MNDVSNTKHFDLTPDFEHLFETMLREAVNQSDALHLFDCLPSDLEAQALRSIQRFLAPLNIAAQSMTNRREVEDFREVLSQIVQEIDRTARHKEEEEAAEESGHPQVKHGLCPVCKHYGEDCTGQE